MKNNVNTLTTTVNDIKQQLLIPLKNKLDLVKNKY